MTRLRTEVRSRLLGNDWFTRPAELDCSFESICGKLHTLRHQYDVPSSSRRPT